MKKFYNVLVVFFLFAVFISITSCSDEGEPKGDNSSKVELKINGENYIFNMVMANLSDDSYSCLLYSTSFDEGLQILICGEISKIKNGYTFNKDNNQDPSISVTWYDEKEANISYLTGGNIRVENFNSNNIKLSFNNTTYHSWYTSADLSIEGTATLPLE